MTNEQINIAIVEACGWDVGKNGWGRISGSDWVPIPDYCNDLNAMHAAWQALNEDQKSLFKVELVTVCTGKRRSVVDYGEDDWGEAINATGCQRAEAFLRTVGKWVEPDKYGLDRAARYHKSEATDTTINTTQMTEYHEIAEFAEYLEEMAQYDGTELGEAWVMLASFWSRSDYVSDEFREALAREIRSTAKGLKENLMLVE